MAREKRIGYTKGVEHFLYRQCEILDGRSWDGWLALFAEDGRCWMPAYEGQETGEGQPNIFYEDDYLMEMRVRRFEHPYAHSQEPKNQMSHVVSNVIIEEKDDNSVIARSKFQVVDYRNDDQRYFAGKYRHHLIKADDGFRIKM